MNSSTQGTTLMPRAYPTLAALPCQIGRSAFPDERDFRFKTFEGKDHDGSGPAHYFWDAENKPLNVDSPATDQVVTGLIAAQVLKIESGRALVEVPDASVARVDEKVLVPRPTEVDLHVPVRS